MKQKVYVIGSGLVGCVAAHELAEAGYQVEVLERRPHAGGNVYDRRDAYGIQVHEYGPHIFHTSSQEVYDFVTRYCAWEPYHLICGAVLQGKCVPTGFNFTAVDTFFPPEEAETIKSRLQQIYGQRKTVGVLELLDCEDPFVRKFAQFLYDNDYAPYTAKQWGIQPEQVDRQVFKRVPIRLSYDSAYFDDPYQMMPKNGYMELVENLLAHERITVRLNCEALEHFRIVDGRLCLDGQEVTGPVLYTGPIDELFGCDKGRLPYRSLRFEWKHEDRDSLQEMPVVAYPMAEGYTRITEYKKLPYQDVRGTTYAVEYPLPYRPGEKQEPYYPVLTEESAELFAQYEQAAKAVPHLYCCGRLADFKYYNMDQAIERALAVSRTIVAEEESV